jgi:cytoskeleton protein RodZ
MRQNIDIADVEAATKIRAKYLRALENEEFGLLPGNTFVKTFLRTYAEYVGLDPQLLLEEYRASYEPRAENDLQPYAVAARRRPREPRPRRPPSGPPGPGTAVIVVVVAVLVIFAILGLTGSDDDGTSADQTKKKAPAQGEKKKEEKRSRPKATEVRLRVAPTVLTYLCVDRGEGTEILYQGTTSEPQRFRGRRLRINVGNSSARLVVNRKRVRVPEGSQPVGYDFVLHSNGKVSTKPIPSGQRPCA